MRVPYVIYADFEALIKKMHHCEPAEGQKASYTEKIELRAALHSWLQKATAGQKTVCLQQGERGGSVFEGTPGGGKGLRESLTTPKPLVIPAEDWEKFKMQKNAIFVTKV